LVILGAQESGVGAARLAQQRGLDVFVSDAGAIKPKYREELLRTVSPSRRTVTVRTRVLGAGEIVKSPGIPDTASWWKRRADKGIPVISEIEFAFRYCKGRIIGITGSNGKTTTTLLTHHILRKAGLDVAVGGNVGTSFAGLVADGDRAWYVLELSSFQLDGIRTFRPDIAILLNITPDHLDRYQYRMENYVASKFRIAMNQRPRTTSSTAPTTPKRARGSGQHP
jgi:UDP-N-acetylmuramoylalanine--D-glutamate ligase